MKKMLCELICFLGNFLEKFFDFCLLTMFFFAFIVISIFALCFICSAFGINNTFLSTITLKHVLFIAIGMSLYYAIEDFFKQILRIK